MKKILVVTMLFVGSIISADVEKKVSQDGIKQDKTVELFGLLCDKSSMSKAYEPIFASLQVTDETTKEKIFTNFMEELKKDFTEVYSKHFNQDEISDLVNFYNSDSGRKYISKTVEVSSELGKSYAKLFTMIQEASPQSSPAKTETPKSDAIIYFADLIDGKTDDEIKELFNKEISHEGQTVVKFSAEWCGPCKGYAPIFAKVAEQAQKTATKDKTNNIKFIHVDSDKAKVIAQEYSVMALPTTIVFKDGKKVNSRPGALDKKTLESLIK